MNTTLLLITMFAVAVAAAALIALFVMVREGRRRSQARIVALRQMAIGDAGPIELPADVPPIDFDDLVVDPGASSHSPRRAMFSDASGESPWGRRIAAAAVTAVIVAAGGFLLIPRNHSGASEAQAAAPPAPLELLSLRHSQEAGRLVITGLVQNPRAGTPLARISATAFLFGADGTFLASGRAPLDFSTLAAGDESPFVVTVPVTSPVARYRIGFRGEDGRVIAHVDRRTTGTLARTGE